MLTIDLNCDMGEGIGNDEAIVPFISSANIACGFHAGDEKVMEQIISLAIKNDVAIGAHPSFFDKENFGRVEMNLSTDEIYDLVILQLRKINEIITGNNGKLHHVKPHGALYNMSTRDPRIANAIAQAAKDFDDGVILFGLSGSFSIEEAMKINLRTASEAFADRTYQDDGSLTPRSQPNALIENANRSVQQVLQMIQQKTVTSLNGKNVPIIADTICIHGDGKNAVEFAAEICRGLKQNNIDIKAI